MVTPLPRPGASQWASMLGRQHFAASPLPGGNPRPLPALPAMNPLDALKAFTSQKAKGAPARGLLGEALGWSDLVKLYPWLTGAPQVELDAIIGSISEKH